MALPYDEQARETSFQRNQHKLVVQGTIRIVSLPLKQYIAEDISLDVEDENIILHGQHQSEREDGFENNEFKKIIKVPHGVDPTTVKSRELKNLKSGSFLVLEDDRRLEEKRDFKIVDYGWLRRLGMCHATKISMRCHRRASETVCFPAISRCGEDGKNHSR